MSAYITFYIQSAEGGPYLELGSYCRSSIPFRIMNEYVPYEKCIELTCEMAREMGRDCNDEIASYQQLIDYDNEEIEFLKSAIHDPVNSETFDSVMQRWHDARESIESIKVDIELVKEFKVELNFLVSAIYAQEFEEHKAKFYVAYECNPNYADEVAEFMNK